jgi:hypothetical protein
LSAWENMRRRRSGWERGDGVGVRAEDRRVDCICESQEDIATQVKQGEVGY